MKSLEFCFASTIFLPIVMQKEMASIKTTFYEYSKKCATVYLLTKFKLVLPHTSKVIFHTGLVGSALCTAAHVSTGTLSACSGWVSSPGTRR